MEDSSEESQEIMSSNKGTTKKTFFVKLGKARVDKTKRTRIRADKSAYQKLKNITNSKRQQNKRPTKGERNVKSHKKQRSAIKMETKNKNDEKMAVEATPPQVVPNCEAMRRKRKISSEGTLDLEKGCETTSPIKKFKESAKNPSKENANGTLDKPQERTEREEHVPEPEKEMQMPPVVIVDDGEKPSTSKAAKAALAAAARKEKRAADRRSRSSRKKMERTDTPTYDLSTDCDGSTMVPPPVVIIDDGEKPSTSKAALAAATARKEVQPQEGNFSLEVGKTRVDKTKRIRIRADKSAFQKLKNITNSKRQQNKRPSKDERNVKSHKKQRSAIKMETKNKNDEKMAVEGTPPQVVPNCEAMRRKRKISSEGTLDLEKGCETTSPIKKFKESAKNPSKENANGTLDKPQERTEKEEHVPEAEKEMQMPPVRIVDDGERPSTSKAANAMLAAAARKEKRAANRQSRNLRKKIKRSDIPIDDPSTDCVGSTTLLPTDKKKSLSEKLSLVISNLYLNATERLKLDFPPRCARDWEHCHQNHYRASLPPAPSHTQSNNMRCALQQQRYLSFINSSYNMCHRGEYPGEGIFTKIIELVLSLNTKCFNNSVGYLLNKFVGLFSFIVRKFPPCWLTLRQFYINLFESPLDAMKISIKNKQPFNASGLFGILIELLEKTLELCSPADLQSNDVELNPVPEVPDNSGVPAAVPEVPDTLNVPSSPPPPTQTQLPTEPQLTQPFSPRSPVESPPQTLPRPQAAPPSPKPAMEPATPPSLAHLNIDNSEASECLNIWEWEAKENRLQTFEALQSPQIRLDRLYISLKLLLQILENDMVMWMLQHHTCASDWIFSETGRPLTVLIFAMSKYSRSTQIVNKLFELYAVSTKKRAKRFHLCILERLISLVMVVSNIADLKHSASGVSYTILSDETKAMIHQFFKTFKSHNPSGVSSYIDTIKLLRIPYVRYEFIDCFLQLFHFSRSEPMSPKKIANDIFKKRWIKYKTRAEMSDGDDEDLTREQYLQLLLLALQAYCDWHGTKEFFFLLIKNKQIKTVKAITSMKQHCEQLKQQEKLRMKELLQIPKIDLPLVDICIDAELILKYRTDLKCLTILNEVVNKMPSEPKESKTEVASVDFTAWRTYLSDYETTK